MDPAEQILKTLAGSSVFSRPNPEDPPTRWPWPWPPPPYLDWRLRTDILPSLGAPFSAQGSEPVKPAVDLITSMMAVSAALDLGDDEVGRKISRNIAGFATNMIDEYCGTPPGKGWPRKGIEMAGEIYRVAESLPDGQLRSSLIQISTGLLKKGISQME